MRSSVVYNAPLFEAIPLMNHEQVTRLGHWFAERIA
jgi:hypothetical protein